MKENLQIEYTTAGQDIVYRGNRTGDILFLIIFSATFLFFLSLSSVPLVGSRGLTMLILLGLIYIFLVNLFNDQCIKIRPDEVIIQRNRPIPFYQRVKKVKRKDVVKAFIEIDHSRYGPSYGVSLELRNGDLVHLVNAENKDDASELLHEISIGLMARKPSTL